MAGWGPFHRQEKNGVSAVAPLIMVRMCLLPELEASHSVTKSVAILLDGCSGIFFVAKCILSYVIPDVLVHAFPVVLMFY